VNGHSWPIFTRVVTLVDVSLSDKCFGKTLCLNLKLRLSGGVALNIEIIQRFGKYYPDDGSCNVFRNVGYISIFTALTPENRSFMLNASRGNRDQEILCYVYRRQNLKSHKLYHTS
jgi:hypothetical protein